VRCTDGSVTPGLNALFKTALLWLCLYPALLLGACQAFYWLRFARFLHLETSKIVAPGFPGFFYNLTDWGGVNILLHEFFQMPLYLTLPIFDFCLLFIFYESALAIYFLLCDSRVVAGYVSRRISKTHQPDRRAGK
jgi:hypothetical protein